MLGRVVNFQALQNAARLIGAIEGSGQLSNAEFAGPTSLRSSDQLEAFVITARAAPALKRED